MENGLIATLIVVVSLLAIVGFTAAAPSSISAQVHIKIITSVVLLTSIICPATCYMGITVFRRRRQSQIADRFRPMLEHIQKERARPPAWGWFVWFFAGIGLTTASGGILFGDLITNGAAGLVLQHPFVVPPAIAVPLVLLVSARYLVQRLVVARALRMGTSANAPHTHLAAIDKAMFPSLHALGAAWRLLGQERSTEAWRAFLEVLKTPSFIPTSATFRGMALASVAQGDKSTAQDLLSMAWLREPGHPGLAANLADLAPSATEQEGWLQLEAESIARALI
ncbi:MAG: hypothetical protein AB8H79_00215 [Myxococcota bacterium]